MRSNCRGITLYNKYADPATRTEKYQRTQIPLVTWENRRAANQSQTGTIAANQVTIYIPLARGAAYLDPRAWQAQTGKAGTWTLQDGDVVVYGLVDDELTDSFTVSKLKAKYDDVLTISSVDRMDLGSPNIQHWQVEAQ